MVDMQCSERCARKGLGVRVSPATPNYGKINSRADVVKWYTRRLEVPVPKGVEVQLLSSAHYCKRGLLAQLVERFIYTEDVRGSSPLESTFDIIVFSPRLPTRSRRRSEEAVMRVRFLLSAHFNLL